MPKKTSGSSEFRGTYADYHYHVGPSIRNRIQAMTKKLRNGRCARPGCEHVGSLDAAHKIDRSRPAIIEDILSEYRVDGTDVIECNLNEVFRKIEDAHRDFAAVFDFICKPCHRAQTTGERRAAARTVPIRDPDAAIRLPAGMQAQPVTTDAVTVELFPSSEDAFKTELLRMGVKRVHVRQWINTGRYEDTVWKADNFTAEANLNSNIRTGYARPKRCRRKGIVRIAFALRFGDLPSA